MKIKGSTDTGRRRQSNQDAYDYGVLSENAAWAVVCDGMGGVNGGNVASTTAVKAIADSINNTWRPEMTGRSVRYMLESAVSAANTTVFNRANADEALAGMGTTVVLCVVYNDVAYIVHAGDSRAYHFDHEAGTLNQITRDHSIVQTLLENNTITEEEARVHPHKNIITRALGVEERLNVEYNEIDIGEDDGIIICTDGLTNYIDSADFCSIVSTAPPDKIGDLLVETANTNGGGDNITVVGIFNSRYNSEVE